MTAWQFFGIFCISLVNGNAALAFVKILDGVVDFLNIIGFVTNECAFL